MRRYPNQPSTAIATKRVYIIIDKILEEDLPDCEVNRWFVKSVNYANMIDKITERLENDNNRR